MRHGSLFSGIGGFDLAAEWMGWENLFHCEWNPFGQKILKYYWPEAKSYEDITKTDFSLWRGRIDILTGGFPCQPYSTAGKRKGKEDERHLWPEMLRAIKEIQPSFVVGENVLGLTNWNGGLVFHEVQIELEAQGYEVLPFILPAAGVNAPHRRDRVWFIAKNSNENGRRSDEREKESCFGKFRNISSGDNERISTYNDEVGIIANSESKQSERMQFEQREVSKQEQREFRGSDCENNASNTNSRRQSSEEHWKKESGQFAKESFSGNWENFPTQSPVCNGDDGLSGRLDGITFPKWRAESVKAGGNAIVPQVAYEIFSAIGAVSRHGA